MTERHDDITRRALAAQRRLDLHLHKSVLEQTLRCLVSLLGIEQVKVILRHYLDQLEHY